MKLNLEPITDALDRYALLSAEIKLKLIELFAIDEKIITPEEIAVRNELSRLYNGFVAYDSVSQPTTEYTLKINVLYPTKIEQQGFIQRLATSVKNVEGVAGRKYWSGCLGNAVSNSDFLIDALCNFGANEQIARLSVVADGLVGFTYDKFTNSLTDYA